MDKKKQIGAHLMVHAEGCCMAKDTESKINFQKCIGSIPIEFLNEFMDTLKVIAEKYAGEGFNVVKL